MTSYKLEYNEKNTKNSFTSVPQNTINVPRLVQGKPDYWERMTNAKRRRKKTLVLADWTAHAWDAVTLAKIQKKLDELLQEGFKIYIWQQDQLQLLTNTNTLLSKGIRANINPAFQNKILETGLRQHKLTHDKSLILDDYQLALLLSTDPETPRTYTFTSNFFDTPHKQIMMLIRAANPPITHLKFETQDDATSWMQLYGTSFSNVTLSVQKEAIIPYITADTVDDWLDKMATYEELRITPFEDLHAFLPRLDLSHIQVLHIMSDVIMCERGAFTLSWLAELLSKTPHLHTLTIDGCDISFDEIQSLHLETLRSLSATDCSFQKDTLFTLLNNTHKLGSLRVANSKYNGLGNLPLEKLPALDAFETTDLFRLHDVLSKIARAAPTLRDVVSDFVSIERNGHTIARFTPTNQMFDKDHSQLSVLQLFSELKSFPDITELEITHVKNITAIPVSGHSELENFIQLVANEPKFQHLHTLHLSDGPLPYPLLEAWQAKMPQIEHLSFRKIQFNDDFDKQTYLHWVNLKTLTLSDCLFDPEFLDTFVRISSLDKIILNNCSGINQSLIDRLKTMNIAIEIVDTVILPKNITTIPDKKTPQPLNRFQSIREKISQYLPTSASPQPQKKTLTQTFRLQKQRAIQKYQNTLMLTQN